MEVAKDEEKELMQLDEIAKKIPDEKKEKASNYIEGFIAAIEFLSSDGKEECHDKPKLKTG